MKDVVNNLKSKALLFLLLAVAGMVKAQQWKELHTGVSEDLYGVCCIDTNTVFVCGRNGVILKTEDGGNSWQEKYRQAGYDWYAIKFLNPNIGFVLGSSDEVGNNEKLFKTVDGGGTWIDMGNPFNANNYCSPSTCDLFLVDADTLYVACDQLMKSTDGGCSFSQMDIEWMAATQDLYFEENVGYVVWGEPGDDFTGTHVAKTTDYGSSWEEILTFDEPEYGIEKAVFHDKDHVSLYGGFVDDGNVEYNEIRTDDGFATSQWLLNETIPTGYFGAYPPISGISFSDPQNGIVIYFWDAITPSGVSTFQTQDGGNTWHELGALNCTFFCLCASVSGCEGIYYLALGKGSVYKLEKTCEGVSEGKGNIVVFPNPATNTLFVYGKENSNLILYDCSGRVLLQQKIMDEIQKVEIGDFSPGLYYMSIIDAGKSLSFQKILKK